VGVPQLLQLQLCGGGAGQVRVKPELARLEGAPEGEFALQIGISSPAIANADRPLMNVTLVLDESGSMAGAPIELEKEVCRQIAGSLRAGDVVSLVGWDTANAVKMSGHKVTKASDPALVAECDALAAGGGTDLNGGLIAGYALANEHFDAGRVNRVVLISDGGANAGVTDIDLIAASAGDKDQDGIYLVGVGVGTPDYYNDDLMDTVTDVGKGASLFVGSAAEAEKMFKQRFVATMQVAARDVRVRLDLPPGFEVVKFSGEEISTDPAEVEPQHLAPNDAMVFHQTLTTCAPQLIDEAAELSVTVRYLDAVTFEPREVIESRKILEEVQAASPLLLKGAAVFAYAEGLKSWRDGQVAHDVALAPAFAALAAAEAALPGDADLAEIRGVLEAVQSMG
jgi:Ca-activated chloride channel family protein